MHCNRVVMRILSQIVLRLSSCVYLAAPPQVLMCVTDCKYDVVREAARERGWKLVDEDAETSAGGAGGGSTTRRCHVYWVDVPVIAERMQQLQPWQRINHFPGMSNVSRKSRLAQNLDRMRRSFPQEFSFYPRTWVLPAEWGGFKAEFDANGKSTRTFIIKPDSGCQGKGIFLTQDLDRVASMDSQVAQLYVRRPLLIEGFKFDLRLYVLVTSVIPLRMYTFKDGLARFCTEEYLRPSSDNLSERCMHLTNYAVNKGSDNFVANAAADRDDRGSKRSLRWLLGWIATEYGGERAELLWRMMCTACVRTLVSILPTLHREYLHTFGPDGKEGVRSNEKHTVGMDDGREELDQTGNGNNGVCSFKAEVAAGTGLTTGATAPYDHEPSRKLDEEEEEEETGSQRPLSSTIEVLSGTSNTRSNPRPEDAGEGGVEQEDWEGEERPLVDATTRCEARQESGSARPATHEDQFKDAIAGAGSNGTGDGTKGAENGTKEGMVEGSRCIEILGIDFMIDASLKPWLIEVNHLPSFATESPLDRRIKAHVVGTALSVLQTKADDRKSYMEATKRDAKNRLYNPDSMAAGAGATTRERERKEAEAMLAKIRDKASLILALYGFSRK